MSTEIVRILIDASVKGKELVTGLKRELSDIGPSADTAKRSFAGLATGLAVGAAAFYGATRAAGALYNQLKQAANIDYAADKFDNLARSIGTTADALLNELRESTSGMVSDLELVASASEMVSLGLTKTSAETVRLTTVSGMLGWNMQQVVLTLANMSTMRLDALGLSVEEVTTKAKELEKAGMSAQDAFKEAVILAGEAKMGLLGDKADTAAGAFAKLEASGADVKAMLGELAITAFSAAGGIEAVGNAANNLRTLVEVNDKLKEFDAAGLDTTELKIARFGTDWDKVRSILRSLDAQLELNQNTWHSWAVAVYSGIYSTGKFTGYVGAADRAMIAQAARARQAGMSLEAYGYTSYTAALAAEALGGSGIQTSTRQMATQAEMAARAAEKMDQLRDAYNAVSSSYMTELPQAEMPLIDTATNAANVDAMNAELYAQAEAAGASAEALIALAVATGQMSDEQAKAALKAAAVQAKITELGQLIAGGMSIDVALRQLQSYTAGINGEFIPAMGNARGRVDELTSAMHEFSQIDAVATIDIDTAEAWRRFNAIRDAVNAWGYSSYSAAIDAGGGAAIPPGPIPGNAYGGSVKAGDVTWVGERGPELVIWQRDATVVPHGKDGGRGVTVNVTNYVNGQPQRSELDTITEDRMKAALRSLSL